MKKNIIILLCLIIVYQIGIYVYHQYQYNKFEEFFMGARVYGTKKIILDKTFDETNKKNNIKDYTYTFFLENKNNKDISKSFHVTTSFMNDKIIGGGSGSDLDNFTKYFGVEHNIYLSQIPNKKSAYYLVIEYEKRRQIQYYLEITEKLENKKYTIYFKSYPPKKILNAKNQYIKD
ncbi:hypothetical protein [Chryseobacterium sp.]|uniref:hypothetical protein n=1 Tax=Chryseobacterium sp. TaxID=1871047 RepID=UPI0023F7BB52|nr:hypothetical protein [Chryseobacterium sp.]